MANITEQRTDVDMYDREKEDQKYANAVERHIMRVYHAGIASIPCPPLPSIYTYCTHVNPKLETQGRYLARVLPPNFRCNANVGGSGG